MFRAEQIVFVGLPGTDSALGGVPDPKYAGSGPMNVGFHVDHAVPQDDAVRDVMSAGGTVVERGEHALGIAWARVADPDGDVVWI